jgi:hypothetical protein
MIPVPPEIDHGVAGGRDSAVCATNELLEQDPQMREKLRFV